MKPTIIYNDSNKEKMIYAKESLEYNGLKLNIQNEKDIIIVPDFIIANNYISMSIDKKIILIVSDYNQKIRFFNNIVMIQYESNFIKEKIEEKYPHLSSIYNVIINPLPEQKREIEPLNTQNATIFYQGKDDKYDLVDKMFELDLETHYEIKFYNEDSKEEPSKLHKLSWCVSKNPNHIGFINYKIVKEIEDGCLPILIKEYMPTYFFAYPFYVSINDLDDKNKLIKRVKEISSFIAKMDRDDFKALANSIYNGIYINTNWKYNNFLIAGKIKDSM